MPAVQWSFRSLEGRGWRACALVLGGMALTLALAVAEPASAAAPPRPQGPCDIYAAAGDACVAAHSTTRALYAGYTGPLYRVMRQSDGKSVDIGVVGASATPVADPGGYADAAAQDAFCADTYCWITTLYDQSGHGNTLVQAPRGGFSGPALGGFNNLPVADMAPVTIMGHKVYGVFITPGSGLRLNDARGTAVDDQAEGQYWVINGQHYNAGCCFDYGNAEIDSRDDGNGTMETTYYGNSTGWYHGEAPGPWIMTDQENNLVGCVNADGSKLCPTLKSIDWRFVTGVAKGEPHHWASMGGDARQGPLAVLYDGPRINSTYDPMRKQGAILLGNGGDNSNGSQGTFYEGAMTRAGTYPSDATDQLIQANIVAARYNVARLVIAPAGATLAPTGLQSFAPGATQAVEVAFTNTSSAPVRNVRLDLVLPGADWRATTGDGAPSAVLGAVGAGATASATFNVTSGPAAFNGDLAATARWTDADGAARSETTAEKVRNVSPVRINEFRGGDGAAATPTDAFIELYNAGDRAVDLSNWSLTQHGAQQAIFSGVEIPAGTLLAPKGFYVVGLAHSGLAVSADAGEATIHVLSTAGIKPGDTLEIDNGTAREVRTVTVLGTPAGASTTVWQPLPEGPVITMPAGAANIPVTGVSGFVVGQQVALGYGATYPAVGRDLERYEVVTVTAVGKPGTQAFLAADADAGDHNIKVTSVGNITAGDRIRLDIESVGHGIETVTVKAVGTAARRASLSDSAAAGATRISVRAREPFAVGDTLTIGVPGARERVMVTAIGAGEGNSPALTVAPALARSHGGGEEVVEEGTGLELAAPLRFSHAANLPFSDRGTGISFTPAAARPHSSNEPVQPLGTGITLDRPLARPHAIHAAVRETSVTTMAPEGVAPDQWAGGPALSPASGSIVLRTAGGLAVDSLNYGLMVDPWAGEGYQMVSGMGRSGCRVAPATGPANRSSGRFPDGADTDSNCSDFHLQSATILPVGAVAGATVIKVASVADFEVGQPLTIDDGVNRETAVVAAVGSAGAASTLAAAEPGATVLSVTSAAGFRPDQTITIGAGPTRETAIVVSAPGRRGGARINLAAPLARAHRAGEEVSGTGLTLAAPLARDHAKGAGVTSNAPTPGAPNAYFAARADR